MKQCPVCKTPYADETLNFCLLDGVGLITLRDEEETKVISAKDPIDINVPEPIPTFIPSQKIKYSARQTSKAKKTGLTLGFLIIGLIIFITVCIAAGYSYSQSRLTLSDHINALTGRVVTGAGTSAFLPNAINLRPKEKYENSINVPDNWRGPELSGEYIAQGQVKITIKDNNGVAYFEKYFDGYNRNPVKSLSLPVGKIYTLEIINQSENRMAQVTGQIDMKYEFVERK